MGENEPPKSAYVGEGEAGLEGVCARNWPLVERVNDEGLRELPKKDQIQSVRQSEKIE